MRDFPVRRQYCAYRRYCCRRKVNIRKWRNLCLRSGNRRGGVGSSTRELVLPFENTPRWMDLTIAYFTIARVDSDDRMWRWYNAPGGRSIFLRPDTHGTTRANLTVQQPANWQQNWNVDRQRLFWPSGLQMQGGKLRASLVEWKTLTISILMCCDKCE